MILVHWHSQALERKIDITNERLVKRIAQIMSRKAKQLCPVLTGNLKRSIRADVQLKKGKAELVAGGDAGVAPGVGSPVEYAVFVELGTRHRAATPYLRPAVEEFSNEDLDLALKSL